MSKRHHKKHKKSRKTARPVVSAKLLFLGGIVIMVASFAWYYMSDPSRFDLLKREVVAKNTHNDNIPAVHEKPKFEFYNILPNTAVEVSSNEKPLADKPELPPASAVASIDLTKTTSTKPEVALKDTPKEAPKVIAKNTVPVIEAAPVAKPAAAPSKSGAYLVQVGAFPKFADADRLKAKLIMDGFAVKVNPIDTPKGKWFRVNIGPFASAESAEQQRQRLARAHYTSIVRRT